MTPKQATRSKFANDTSPGDRPTPKMPLDGIAATAKVDEARRRAENVARRTLCIRGLRVEGE